MERSRLKSKANKTKVPIDIREKKQRNYIERQNLNISATMILMAINHLG